MANTGDIAIPSGLDIQERMGTAISQSLAGYLEAGVSHRLPPELQGAHFFARCSHLGHEHLAIFEHLAPDCRARPTSIYRRLYHLRTPARARYPNDLWLAGQLPTANRHL